MINHTHEFIFVHAGKCGGSTIEALLKTNNIKHESIHCGTCNFNKNKKYLILLRNPVERFISAFYWRKYLVEELKPDPEQKKFFQKYKSINDLCKELYIDKADAFCTQRKKRKEKISEENRLHLKKYLKKDYEVIDYFYDIGSLNKDKYNLLSI